MKFFFPVLTGLLVSGALLPAQDLRVVDAAFLSALKSEALHHHPAASAAKLRASAAGREVGAVRLWDDPTVGLTLVAARARMREDDGDIRISFEQALPKPGLYEASRSKAEALRRAEAETSRSSSLEVAAAAAKDAIELALADESIALQTGQIEWLGSMTENARGMAINPEVTGIDALRLEGELARETQILEAARRTRASVARGLNLRLGRPLESPWPALRIPPGPSAVPVAGSEIARISRVNPKVRSMKELASAAKAEVRVADRERAPQFSVGVESSLYSGGDVSSVGVGLKMSLPGFNRASYDAKLQASRLREKAAIQDIESARLEIASAVLTATAEIANSAAQANAYSGEIHQRSLAATRSIESSWISSKAPLTDLLAANRLLFSVRLEQRRFVAMQLAALEELNLLVPRN